MDTGTGNIVELILQDGLRHARISCPARMIPSPGQYLLASNGSDSLLPVPLTSTDSTPEGFIAVTVPDSWFPGVELSLRGPLGRGFALQPSARKVCLVAFDDSHVRLRGLIPQALKQGAAVVMVSNSPSENLPDAVEIQPLSALSETLAWADYAAFNVTRERLLELVGLLERLNQLSAWKDADVFVHMPIPCGGIADCGVCAVSAKPGWKLACKDGPVFKLGEF